MVCILYGHKTPKKVDKFMRPTTNKSNIMRKRSFDGFISTGHAFAFAFAFIHICTYSHIRIYYMYIFLYLRCFSSRKLLVVLHLCMWCWCVYIFCFGLHDVHFTSYKYSMRWREISICFLVCFFFCSSFLTSKCNMFYVTCKKKNRFQSRWWII